MRHPSLGVVQLPERVGRMTHVTSEPRLHCQCKLFPLTMSHHLVILSETLSMCRSSQGLDRECPGPEGRDTAREGPPVHRRDPRFEEVFVAQQ